MTDRSMTFLEHLEELRRALIKSFLALVLGMAVCLVISPQLYRWVQKPLLTALPEGAYFIVTTPFEAYWTYFKISLVFGFFLSTPFIFYFFWSFIGPGLHSHEKKSVLPMALSTSALFVGGALFGYFVVFPTGFHFAVKILAGTEIHFFPKMSEYLSFALRLLIAFGILFELPLFLFLLGKLGLVRAQGLRKARKYVIVAIFLVAGILTPGPDVMSQILMALPLLLLFEIGVLLVRFTQPKDSPVTGVEQP